MQQKRISNKWDNKRCVYKNFRTAALFFWRDNFFPYLGKIKIAFLKVTNAFCNLNFCYGKSDIFLNRHFIAPSPYNIFARSPPHRPLGYPTNPEEVVSLIFKHIIWIQRNRRKSSITISGWKIINIKPKPITDSMSGRASAILSSLISASAFKA